jgi:hypothetical protein
MAAKLGPALGWRPAALACYPRPWPDPAVGSASGSG